MTYDREYERHKETCAWLLAAFPKDCSYCTPEFCDEIQRRIVANRIKKVPSNKLKQNFAAITINPPVSFKGFKELWLYALDKFPYERYEMVIEQNTNGGIRPHLHILVPISPNDRKHQIVDKVFMRMNLPSKECVNVRTISKEKDLQAWRNYLQGLKKPEKDSLVQQDSFDRSACNIPDIFSNLKI